jgi:large subunit ribosomal protein L27
VIPGNIIFRQRGTKWFPGENCAMGRDHTIYATEKGYVKYYKDPQKHPKRSYIGVAFAREDSLPSPLNAPRKRRLGMVAVPLLEEEPVSARSNYTPLSIGTGKNREKITRRKVTVEPGYVYRETNYQIGKAMEKAAAKVRPYQRGERFLAWRKKTERIERSADFRAQKQAKKQKRTQAKQAVAKKMPR